MNRHRLGSWPDLVTARSFLGFLAGTYSSLDTRFDNIEPEQVASWLVEQGIAPLAYALCQRVYPELTIYLQQDAFSAAAENSLHWQILDQIHATFAENGIPIVLLKGAALANTVYGGRDRRTMSDVDIWLQKTDVQHVCDLMHELGFVGAEEKEDRPLALQVMSDGEIQFFRPGWQQSVAEFHLSPFSGWWLKRTSAVDNEAIWSRKKPLKGWTSACQLSAEDMIIHIAVHMVINHQCGFWAIRSLMDLALTANKRVIEWESVAKSAKQWRVGNAVWLALQLLHQLFGVQGLEGVLAELRPSPWKSRYLQKLVNPDSLILGADLRSGHTRYLFLLLLVDRYRDTGYLAFRTLWPERTWLDNRYGESASHWQHLNQIIRYGKV